MAGDIQSQLQTVKTQMQNPSQPQQSKDDRRRGEGNQRGTESTMFHPPVPGRGGNDEGGQLDADELARRERNRREDERRAREGERPRDDRRERGPRGDRGGNYEGGRGNFRGRQDGGFVPEPVQPRREPRPAVGQEAAIRRPENVPENRAAKMILELGKVSVALKTLCSGLLKYTKHEDTESTQVGEEKTRLTLELTSYIEASDELRTMLVDKNKPTIGDLEIAKAQTTIHMLELLREIDNLDNEAISLPEKDTIEWRRLEKAKNELRLFVGDTESITPIPETALRGGTSVARLPKLENSAEEPKHVNPPIAKLFNALYKQEDLVSHLISWHKEYVLGGGIDTFREKNIDAKINPEEITLLKEVLSILAENIRELTQNKESSQILINSRRDDYMTLAEILSGKPKPGSPAEWLSKTLSTDYLNKEIKRISEDRMVRNKAPSDKDASVIMAQNLPHEASPVEVSKVTPELNQKMVQMSQSGTTITKEILKTEGYTEKEADEFLEFLEMVK